MILLAYHNGWEAIGDISAEAFAFVSARCAGPDYPLGERVRLRDGREVEIIKERNCERLGLIALARRT